jgi:signal transduction histidine kinase
MTSVALPRAVAARVTVSALAATQRVIAATGAVVAAAIVVDVLIESGLGEQALFVVSPVVGIGALAILLLWRPGVMTAALFVGVGAVLTVAFPIIALAVDPQFDDAGPYLLNRIPTALCLVGAVTGRAINGVWWSIVAFVVAQSSLVVGLAIAGSSVQPGMGPAIVFGISLVSYLTLALAQRQAERQLQSLTSATAELVDADRRRALEQRAAAVVHDTVLADLSALARSPGVLSDRTKTVLTEHLAAMSAMTVADEAPRTTSASALRRALLELAHEYQWSGVRVDVSGTELLDVEVSASTRHAVVGAVRAALDNVVKHAGTDRAELVAGIRDGVLSVLVVDDGRGFAVDEVAHDRLGIRMSIEQRIAQAGGRVRIWSGPEGTTVMVAVPIEGSIERADA